MADVTNREAKTETNHYPSYLECVANALYGSPEPLTLEALIATVERTRPLSRGGRNAIHRAVDALYQAVPVSAMRVGWLPHLLRGNTIRHSLEADEARRGFIFLDELEHAFFFPAFFQEQLESAERTLKIELFGGPVVAAKAAAEQDIWALQLDAEFRVWLDEQGVMPDDDLIMRADDAPSGRYTLRLQPREVRDEEAIAKRNRDLARTAEEAATELAHRRTGLFTWELVARLIGSGIFRDPVPADDMHYVLEEYSRLHLVEGVGYELELIAPAIGQDGEEARTRGQSLKQPTAADPGKHLKPPRLGGRSVGEVNQRSQPQGGDMDLFDFGGSAADDEDSCDAYEEYLEAHEASERKDEPLSHTDFHLLEAELESLVDLELEFGYLMNDQQARKTLLADRIFIDPESLVDGSWDEGDDIDPDSPALWN